MHTPGPWIIEGIESPVYGSNGAPVANGIGIGTQSRHVATVYTSGRNAAVINHANAALISAAPDLLEALKALLQHEGERTVNGIGLECDSEALERAKERAGQAIANAEGM